MTPSFNIEISLNGTLTQISSGTLADLVALQNPEGGAIAAAVNGEFVPRSQHQITQLQAGDCVDLLTPVGGG